MPPIAIGKILSAIGIRGGIAIALGIALAIVMWRADSISGDRENLRNALATEKAEHNVTKAELQALRDDLARMVNDGVLREERLEQALKAQREKSADLRREAEIIREVGGNVECTTPDAIMSSKGL